MYQVHTYVRTYVHTVHTVHTVNTVHTVRTAHTVHTVRTLLRSREGGSHKRLYKAPTDYTKPRQTLQSPRRTIQRPKIINKTFKKACETSQY